MQIALLAAATTALHAAGSGSPTRGSVRLFVDPRVADTSASGLNAAGGWVPVIGPVTKDPANPLLVEDKLWDVRWDNTYITSMYDEATGRFRLW